MLEALGETPWLEERVSCALLEASVDIASIPVDVNELQPGSNALQQPSLLSTLLGCLFCWRGLLLLCVAEEASLRANMPCDVTVGHDNVATWTYLPLGLPPARVELINVHWFHAGYH